MGDVVPDLNDDMGYFAGFAEGRSYLVRVPGAAHSPLSDSDLAEVMNWMLRTFAADDNAQPYTEAEVTKHRRVRMNDVQAVRKQLLENKPAASSSVGAFPAQSDQSRAPAPAFETAALTPEQQQAFGEALFFDTSLSRYGNQACASCHDPGRAFADPRSLGAGAGASIGSDGTTIGQRNAPSLTYAAASPDLALNDTPLVSPLSRRRAGSTLQANPADSIRGGFFWDGRVPTLEQQVLTPFINAGEMGLHDLTELVERIDASGRYQAYLDSGMPGRVPEADVLARVADALVTYLRSDVFNSYDSRYDRFLRGEITATAQEMAGMGLFFSPGFTNCATCHQSSTTAYAPGELFSNHRYENIGSPVNRALLASNGLGDDFLDQGLAMNSAASADYDYADLNGRVKVPSLRNVAVTAPYMHNGVFTELATVVRFYNHYNESGSNGRVNPETGKPWGPPNNREGIATQKLRGGFPHSELQISALTAFLRMLTDERYEHLLPP